ncbi:BON domain-containing protein [Chitinolyticbacter meiyuanensis]|uniref:BON domain-containing protein n=1 Tax=Chitinolyticbacter meiyuanensis TaxID=682798 RepID=UPI001652583A|nr:BON domain-containing protein [Chitinolyticbacter meiyuanensis]
MKKPLLITTLVTALGLTACVPAVFVAGAAVGALVGSDPRPTQTQTSDMKIAAEISARIIDAYKERAHVNVNVFNGRVLLTGEVPDDAARQNAAQLASSYPGAKVVHNETVVAPPSPATDRLNDTQITARVKTAILTDAGDAQAIHFVVTTERKVVYLMGQSSSSLADVAARAASYISGVERVVKYIDIKP